MSFNVLNVSPLADKESAFLRAFDDIESGKPDLRDFSAVQDMDQMNRNLKRSEQLEHGRRLLSLAEGSETTKDYRLVKKCKSPTRLSEACETYLESKRMQAKNEFFARAEALDAKHAEWLKKPLKDQTYTQSYQSFPIDLTNGLDGNQFINKNTGEILKPVIGRRAAVARIYEREWANSYRIRVMAQGSASEPPPQQEGDRETSQLSQKGASKILDSGAYVSAVRGGFTTFLTLTFDSEARERIATQETTIGKEVSRFFDLASKTYQRGWQCDNNLIKNESTKNKGFDCIGASEVVAPKGDGLDYLWVAEMPENKETGKPNPHCHVLLRWSVEPHLFYDWAARLERNWGLGFANLKRIHNADAASGYLIKALGYVVKGEAQDQGTFKGNRYNISKAARAPAWECLAEFEAQNMCAIINEVREKWQRKDKPIQSIINKTKWKLSTYKKAYNIQKAKKGRTQEQRNFTLGKMQNRIAEFEKTIKDNYEKLTSRGARANEYQVTFDSPELLAKFVGWANTTRLWGAEMLSGYLRDCSAEREAVGELVKQARDYWKSFGDNQEYSEQLWEQRINAANNYQFNEPQLCDSYNEYLTLLT